MKIQRRTQQNRIITTKKTFSSQEMNEFSKMVDRYRKEYTVETGSSKGEVIKVVDKHELMCEYGAESKEVKTKTRKDGTTYQYTEYFVKPDKLKEFDDIWEQYQARQFAVQMRNIDLEKLARQKHV